MRLNESQSLFAKTLCLCHVCVCVLRVCDMQMRMENRRSACIGVEWNATKLKVICMQSSVDFFLSMSVVFSLPFTIRRRWVTIWILSVRCAKIDFVQFECVVPPSPTSPGTPSSTELYIFKFAHFDIQNTELITMTSRQIKSNALNAIRNTLWPFVCALKLAVKMKIDFFSWSSGCGVVLFLL